MSPDRKRSEPTCVFDRIVAGEAAAHMVVDEPDIVAFLDQRPVFPGHTLVIPRYHYATLADLPEEMLEPLLATGRRVAAALRRALGAEGAFLALNDEVSQSVPHVHLHVVPRRRGDGLRGFFWPRVRYDDDVHAAETADALRDALGSGDDQHVLAGPALAQQDVAATERVVDR